MEGEIIYSRQARGGHYVAEITLNRPEKGNALTLPMLDQIEAAVKSIEGDDSVRAVLLRGRGRFFCTGGDIAAWGRLSPRDMAQVWIGRGIEVISRLAGLPQPVIAVVSGHAIGGGLELALAADFRVAIASAKFSTPEVGLGMIAGWGGVRKLGETIGVARAREMTLLGAPIDAPTASAWGLVTTVANDAAGLDAATDALLQRLLANAPLAMAATKRLLGTLHLDMRNEHAAESERVSGTDDCREGVTAFHEKRPPVFHHR